MKKLSAYSFWLMPDQKVSAWAEIIIKKLGSEHNVPVFEPHATILGSSDLPVSELKEIGNKLASEFKPFEVVIDKIDYNLTYYQCVFAKLKSNPTLFDLCQRSRELEGRDESIFMPHISLLYANIDIKKRAEIAESIELEQRSFTASKLVLTPSTPDPSEWKHLAEFEL